MKVPPLQLCLCWVFFHLLQCPLDIAELQLKKVPKIPPGTFALRCGRITNADTGHGYARGVSGANVCSAPSRLRVSSNFDGSHIKVHRADCVRHTETTKP